MSREEAIEILSEMRSEYNLFGDEEEATRYHVLSWAIKEMNAELVKHGRWMPIQKQPYFRKHFSDEVSCSVCHKKGHTAWNYCPNCGAKMDGGKDDADNR